MAGAVIENAKIVSTQLGGYDGGTLIMTCWLTLVGDGWGQGFGGYGLDRPLTAQERQDSPKRYRAGTAYGMEFITRIIETVGVDKWEDLPGKYVRFRRDGVADRITAIGHITDDKWFCPETDLASFR